MVNEFEKIETKSGEKIAMDTLSSLTPDDVLMSHMSSSSCADMHACSKTFTRIFGALSFVDHIVGVSPTRRSLEEVCVSRDSGEVFVRIDGLKSRIGECIIPFRLTRNIQTIIGERNMVGTLPATMRAIADCIDQKSVRFMEFLDLIELLIQHDGLTDGARSRLSAVVDPGPEIGEIGNLTHKILDLLTDSMDASNLASIHPRQFLPWF
jgi:hypothetical protein